MKTDYILNQRQIGEDYFMLKCDREKRNKKYNLQHYLNLFNFDEYWCYKSSNKFKNIKTLEELKEFNYSAYIFFKKTKYNRESIENWIKWLNNNNISLTYLSKPFPPISLIDKIEIIESL